MYNGVVVASDFYVDFVCDNNTIRPVVNLNKCAVENGLFEDEFQVEDGCIGDNVAGAEDLKKRLM